MGWREEGETKETNCRARVLLCCMKLRRGCKERGRVEVLDLEGLEEKRKRWREEGRGV